MKESFDEIPKYKFSNELKKELYKLAKSNTNLSNKYLFEVVNCKLSDNSIINLLQNPNFKLPDIQTENVEILARINDFKFFIADKDKLDCIKKAIEFYLETYKLIKDLDYLVRALSLVRKVKPIFAKKLLGLREYIVEEIKTLNSSYYKLTLLESSLYLKDEHFGSKLIDYFKRQLEESINNHEYSDTQNFIKALNKLGHINNIEFKIQTALCLEKKADYYVSQKAKNSYYPNILSIYTESIREIKGISSAKEIKNRLEQKIKFEQSIYSEMLTKARIKTKIKSNITEQVKLLGVENFNTGFNVLLDLPIVETKMIESLNEKRDRNYFFSQFFKDYIHITEKGTVSGITDEQNYFLNVARNQFRQSTISTIREIKIIMDFDRFISKELVALMIDKCDSSFIPEERKHFFIEGIYSGFQNDFVIASHILIPQIENSLKNIVELCNRNVTKVSEEIQNDNTLGAILSTEKDNKMLDGICDGDLLLELNSFLVDGNSINFRNRICHGLISPSEVDYYGIYLWWLALKMVKQTNKYFKITE